MRASALILVFILASGVSAHAAAQNVHGLVGSWERFAQTDRNGKPTPVEIKVVLIVNPDGYYSQIAIRGGRSRTTRPLSQLTLKEIMARYEGAAARYGRFTIAGDTLHRTVMASLDPTITGVPQTHVFNIVGDTLILKLPSSSDKTEVRFRRMR